MGELHPPISVTDEYLKAVHDRLGETNQLLRSLLDRTPEPTAKTEADGPVELREPATAAQARPGASDEAPAEPADLAEPAQPAKQGRRPASRTRSTATKKGA
ncbi:hypothetical protein GCM10009530_63770 [Microbispora corallina]|uniref:Uncharacterized protein n=1 Tax=Microbispora corallina TaxID=83302 RepID=A0ABQ4GBY1_9ACTN|nr:hypothetical protein [Microbispora corallina]GIH44600.1 hypothetical protein Mco01_76000 [Microbispora corallina]